MAALDPAGMTALAVWMNGPLRSLHAPGRDQLDMEPELILPAVPEGGQQ